MAKSLLLSLGSQTAVLLLLVVTHGTPKFKAQNRPCTDELSNLNVCAPFVVPGASKSNSSAACCSALQQVDHDCLCNTIRIAYQLPSQCQIPSLACGANY